MKNHGGRFFFILLITALSVWLWLDKGIKLGLDLAGGSSLTYAVKAEGDVTREKLNKAIEVITKRVNATGLTEIFITQTASNEIVVEMPRRSKQEIESVKALIERNGELEFRIREDSREEANQLEKRDANPVIYRTPADRRWVPWNPTDPRASMKEILVRTPEAPAERRFEELKATKGLDAPETKAAEREVRDQRNSEVFRGEDLESVGLTTQGAQIVVAFEFKDPRKNDFKAFTQRNVGKQMAIILDGKVSSDPVIRSELPGRGIIEGGGPTGFTEKEANDLRIVLESGSTGVHLQLEREETLGASLGEVAIEAGKWSVLVGFAGVVLLMFWYYRMPGMIANLALLLNVVLTLGILAFFRGALSLPGIAGIVLTLGMAVDANILIFERLRDERKRGKSLQESLAAGYDNAMSAIIDGNVTTLLTALVLIWLGTGPVRGFGTTLTIGLLVSMFTAIWVTRTVFEWLVDRKIMTDFDIGKDPREPKIDYMKYRRVFTAPSIVLMIASTVGFLARDEAASKDLEFIGGQQVIVQLREPVSAEEITRAAKGPANEWEDATAVALESEGVDAPKGTTNRWQIRAKADSEAKGRQFVEQLRSALGTKLQADAFSAWTDTPAAAGGKARTSFVIHTTKPAGDAESLRKSLEAQQFTGVVVEAGPDPNDALAQKVTLDTPDGGAPVVKERVRKALLALAAPVQLSDPLPSVSFLSPVQAEQLWRIALEALLVSLAVQVIYIRFRFADYTHGFAAVLALVHDVTIALGAVALFDAMGLVYAKVNLVLIASFLTLIGYSMNDTIVIFDRIRENLGRSKVVRSRIVNDSINQTFARSIRTGLTVFLAVIVQFFFNRNLGSSIEGFAWVMIVGSISGSYSSIFIAAPMLLFLPGYGKKLMKRRGLLISMVVATIVGTVMAITAKGHGTQLWIGAALASCLPVHFLAYFLPWLGHPDPDALVVEETGVTETDDEPLQAPGV
jgi:SecD/SecF fusion protein